MPLGTLLCHPDKVIALEAAQASFGRILGLITDRCDIGRAIGSSKALSRGGAGLAGRIVTPYPRNPLQRELYAQVDRSAGRHNVRERDTIEQMALLTQGMVGKRLTCERVTS